MMALCRFYLWSNQGMIMLSTCASRTILIYWSLSDYYSIEKQHIRPLGNLAHHHVGENCRFAAEPLHGWMTAQMATRLTYFTFVQTHKKSKVSIISNNFMTRRSPWNTSGNLRPGSHELRHSNYCSNSKSYYDILSTTVRLDHAF